MLINDIGQPIERDGITISLGASIGIAIYPDHGEDGGSLQESSDRAMYRAKSQAIGYLFASPPG